MKPLVAKLDPHLTHHAKQELELAKQYATRILRGRKVRDSSVGIPEKSVADHLVSDFPAHEFLVGRREARALGLPIIDADKYDKWAVVKALHRKFRQDQFTNRQPKSIIQAWTEPDNADEETRADGSPPQGVPNVSNPNSTESTDARTDPNANPS